MNAGIQPPGGAPQYTPLGTGGFRNVGNSRSRQQQLRAMVYQLAIQLGFDPLKLSSEERNLLESMANAMVPLDPLPDRAGPTTGSTTTAGQQGEGSSFMDRFGSPLQDARLEKIKNMAKGPQGGGGGGGSMPGFGGAPTTQDGPLLWDDSKNKGDGNKAISVGGNEPATNKDLEDIINGYKSRRNAPTPPLMSPPPATPTTPPGGSATGSAATNNYGMGNYTSASLAEMLQQLLGRRGGFGGGWRV